MHKIRFVITALLILATCSLKGQVTRFNKSYPLQGDISGIWNIYQVDTIFNCIGIRSFNNTYGIYTLNLFFDGSIMQNNSFIDTNYIYYSGFEKNTCKENNLIHQVITRKKEGISLYEAQYLKYNMNLDTISTNIIYSDTLTQDAFDCVYFDNYLYTAGTKIFNPQNTENFDFMLIKTDINGNKVWINNYGGNQADMAYQIIRTFDNELLISGLSLSYGTGIPIDNGQWFVIKTDTSGQSQWQKLYGNPSLLDGRPRSLIETSDTCYIITGSLAIEKPDAAERLRGRILKIDRNGNIVWDRLFGNKTLETYVGIIKEKINSNLISIVNDGLPNIGYYMIIQELTPEGDIKWFRNYKYSPDPYGYSVLNSFDFTSDGGYIFAGYGIDNDSIPSQRSWVIKTDSLGFDGTFYQGDTTLGISLTTDTVCYGDSSKLVFNITGKSAPYSVQLSNGASKDSIFYSPYFESYAFDSLYIYPPDSNAYYNYSATVTDPWGNTATGNFTVWVKGCSTEISENELPARMVDIFPNPATTELQVEIREVMVGMYTITIFDMQGKKVDAISTKDQDTMIDISKYPQGVYCVRVLGNNIARTERIIKFSND